MSALLFYLVIKPISLLPFWVLYGLSDFLYLIIYKILGYRTSVVKTNLINSFPDKSPEEIKTIQNKFYHHFFDLIIESIKLFSISKKEVLKRFKFTNPEITYPFYERGQNLIVVAGHYGNWEFAATAPADSRVLYQMATLYFPLSNKFLEKKIKQSREKFGFMLIPGKDVKVFFNHKFAKPTMLFFLSDQSPPSSKNAYWTRFLNQDTGVLYGAENYAKKYNYPVFFARIKRIKRGFNEFTFEYIEENPASTSYGEITKKHVQMLEKQIIEQPEFWLWTHRRWKREKPEDVVIT